jgi:dihydrodipicolinate synthase/N-acetylneuraminate lyase
MAKHAAWLLENGCTGLVLLASLGESPTLSFEEKLASLKNIRSAVPAPTPVVAAVSALSTAEAVAAARSAADSGCDGLMVLPPYVYVGDWPEMKAHVAAVCRATPLSCMLYNNPVAYGADFTAEQIRELALEHENLRAVKESSIDARRVAAIRPLCEDRLAVLVGVEDVVVEGIAVGATG